MYAHARPSAVDVSTDLCAFGGLRDFGYSVTGINGSNRFFGVASARDSVRSLNLVRVG